MTNDRDALQVQLNRLTLAVGRMKREHPDPADFWPEFAGQADTIVDAAGPDEHDWVLTQIDGMLERNGLAARP